MTAFPRFTDRFRQVFAFAKACAITNKQAAIGPEHSLCGLLQEGNGTGIHVLKELGIDHRVLKTEAQDSLLCLGTTEITVNRLLQTENAKKVVAAAIQAAGDIAKNHVGTEHLLLGLTKDNGPPGDFLRKKGIDYATCLQCIKYINASMDKGVVNTLLTSGHIKRMRLCEAPDFLDLRLTEAQKKKFTDQVGNINCLIGSIPDIIATIPPPDDARTSGAALLDSPSGPTPKPALSDIIEFPILYKQEYFEIMPVPLKNWLVSTARQSPSPLNTFLSLLPDKLAQHLFKELPPATSNQNSFETLLKQFGFVPNVVAARPQKPSNQHGR